MTQALRAQWYDVAPEHEADFLNWLHLTHLPRLAKISGLNWIGHYQIRPKPNLSVEGSIKQRRETHESIPRGSQFILLESAPVECLMNPDENYLHLEQAPELQIRQNWREAIFIEEARVNGPSHDAQTRDQTAPPAMQLGNFIASSPEGERQLALYYRKHRFLQVAATQLCRGARKYVSIMGWPKHGILYEFDTIKPDEMLFEARMNAARPDLKWAGAHPLDLVIHAPNAPHAGERIWP